jgi:chromosome segregation ATPase
MNPLLFAPTLIKRALDDVGAVAHAARQVGAHLAAVRSAVEPLPRKLDVLSAEVRPIQELSAVRAQLDALGAAVERLGGNLDDLRREVEPLRHLAQVRAGIEPLDDDLRQVRESIDTIEPLVKGIGSRIEGIDGKLTDMSGDLAPVGDLAEKMPGVTRSKPGRE